MWALAILGMPWDLVEDMEYFTVVTTFMFAWAYFTLDRIALEMENPFGFHHHALPLDALLLRLEISSRNLLAACGEPNDEAAPPAPRFDLVEVLRPLLNGAALRDAKKTKRERQKAAAEAAEWAAYEAANVEAGGGGGGAGPSAESIAAAQAADELWQGDAGAPGGGGGGEGFTDDLVAEPVRASKALEGSPPDRPSKVLGWLGASGKQSK